VVRDRAACKRAEQQQHSEQSHELHPFL